MRCPLCNLESLSRIELEQHLVAKECRKCGGYWISSTDYWKWLEHHGQTLPEKTFLEVNYDVEDPPKSQDLPRLWAYLDQV